MHPPGILNSNECAPHDWLTHPALLAHATTAAPHPLLTNANGTLVAGEPPMPWPARLGVDPGILRRWFSAQGLGPRSGAPGK